MCTSSIFLFIKNHQVQTHNKDENTLLLLAIFP